MAKTAVSTTEPGPRREGPRVRSRRSRLLRAAALGAAGLLLLLAVGPMVLDGPMRAKMERQINQRLKGYSVRLGDADLGPLGLSVVLREVEIRQDSNPEPPVAVFPRLSASVQWKALLSFRLVADFLLEEPRLHIDLTQLRSEVRSETALEDKGWQEAALAIFPLRINLLEIRDGKVTYIDEDPDHPLELADLDFEASDIRNVRSEPGVYPSPIRARALVFESGRVSFEGHANFLMQPQPGLRARFRVEDLPLDRLRPVVSRANLALKGGVLSAAGDFELAPEARSVHLADLTVRGLRLDVVRRENAEPPASGGKVEQASQKASPRRGAFRIDRLAFLDSNFGIVNQAADPPYRVYLDQADLRLSNFATDPGSLRPGLAELQGRFQGSGRVRGSLRQRASRGSGMTFDLDLAIEGTDMTKLNSLLRAHGNFDVVKGSFSLYSEMRVEDGIVQGYVKPLFQDMEVYDRRQEANKNIFTKVYESVVDVVAELLENRREEVATVARLTGRVANPKASTLQVLAGLLENAFFKAILPGFEESALRAPRPKKT